MKVRDVDVENISVKDRFREDLGNLDELTKSIEQKGLIQPITVDENFTLLAGGRRLAAAKAAGLKKISAVIRKTEDELDAKEIELFENIHRKDMTWQEQMKLTARIHSLLKAKHQDNWPHHATAKLMGKSRQAVSDAIELTEAMQYIPEIEESSTADSARKKYKRLVEAAVVNEAVKEAVSKTQKRSIVWASNHYNVGDFNKQIASVADGVMHFAEVDPPYGIDLKAKRKDKGDHIKSYNEIEARDYPDFLLKTAQQVYRVLYDNAFCIWWFGPTWHNEVYQTLKKVGFSVDVIPAIWYKPMGGQTNNPDRYLARCYEPFFVCSKGIPVLRSRGRGNVFAIPGVPPSQRIHSTERPVELMEEILETFAYPQARVIVPFLGSGNTLIACYKKGMVGFGYDTSNEYKKHFLARVAKEFPDDFNLEEQKM